MSRHDLILGVPCHRYKVASATRCDSDDNCWAMDLAMPWWAPTRWADYHWDLNVQMSYWLVLPSNHPQLGESLVRMMKRNLPYLIASVAPEYRNDSAAQAANTGFEGQATCSAYLLRNTSWDPERGFATGCYEGGPGVQLGNLAWVAHNLWMQYRYTMSNATLAQAVVPVLSRAVNYYLRLKLDGPDGRWHLPRAQSPEYAAANDTNCEWCGRSRAGGPRPLQWPPRVLTCRKTGTTLEPCERHRLRFGGIFACVGLTCGAQTTTLCSGGAQVP